MVQLAFSTNAYTETTLPDAVRRIAEHGYDGVEVLADTPHAFFPEFQPADREALQRALEEADIDVSNINANTAAGFYDDAPPSSFFDPTIITADDEDREWRIQYTKNAIDLASAVNSPSVCLATGRPLPGNPPEKAREYLLDSLDEITNYAQSAGVSVGIEYEPELLIECTDEVIDLIETVDSDYLGVNLDLGHAAVYGEDPVEAIHKCDGHITGIHLEDIVGGRRGKHYHRIPGEGDIDFQSIFEALDEINYTGFATMELYTYPDNPDHAATTAYEHLESYV